MEPSELKVVDFGHQKQPSSSKSNRILILVIIVFILLAISIKVINFQTQLPKGQPQSIEQRKAIEPTYANLTKLKQQRNDIIEKIRRSQKTFECIKVSPLPHYLKDQQIYFASDYGIFIQGCILLQNYPWSGTRQNLRRWNDDREVTEWALQRLNLNEKILYYRPEVYNIAEVTLLRRLIGPTGEIVIVESGLIKECLGATLNIYGSNSNIRYDSLASLKTLSGYTTIIADISLFTKLNTNILEHSYPSSKTLIFAKNSSDLKRYGQIEISQFRLPKEDCGKGYFSQELSEGGFYEIKQDSSRKRVNNTPIINFLQGQYYQRKTYQIKKILNTIQSLDQMQQKCLNLETERRYEQVYLSIYGRQLVNVTQQEVQQWEGRRQAVEWLRSKFQGQPNSSRIIYYEMNQFNLVAIVEIAILVENSTFYVVCAPAQCDRIKQQVDLYSTTNIQLLVQQSLQIALASDFLITDNETLTERCLKKSYSSHGQVLAYFTHTRDSSLSALRRLYVRHQIREVLMRQSLYQCLGFEYLHYFWNSQEPQGFYELKPSTYVVYSFWSESPKKLKTRKRFLIEQLTNIDVESKILGPETFMYFSVSEYPIHPAFPFLSFVHKSDYFRMYMMNSYGGGYCDVKHIHFGWRQYLEALEKDPDHYGYGYGQIYSQDVACYDDAEPSCNQIRSHFRQMAGNGQFAYKRGNPLSREWFRLATSILDKKYEEIKQNPAQDPRQRFDGHYLRKDGTNFVSKYPLRWAQLAGELHSRAQYKYLGKVKITLPFVIMLDYRNLFDND